MKRLYLLTIVILFSSCASLYKEKEGVYGSYTKTNILPSGRLILMEDEFSDAMRFIDSEIHQEDYFGHLSDSEYQLAINEIITGLAYSESSYSPYGFYYYKDYSNEKEYYDLLFKAQPVTYRSRWTGPNSKVTDETSVITVETNPASILRSTFDSTIIYLVLRSDDFYILKSADDVNSFVGKNFDERELVAGEYLKRTY